ncbi:hypothetical protein [Plectonema radiosum]|nr:hypothetical protein [Plectonema radiosum]
MKRKFHATFWRPMGLVTTSLSLIPVKVFIRLILDKWEKDDKVSGEKYLVDSEDVIRDLDDIADEPQDKSTDDVN